MDNKNTVICKNSYFINYFLWLCNQTNINYTNIIKYNNNDDNDNNNNFFCLLQMEKEKLIKINVYDLSKYSFIEITKKGFLLYELFITDKNNKEYKTNIYNKIINNEKNRVLEYLSIYLKKYNYDIQINDIEKNIICTKMFGKYTIHIFNYDEYLDWKTNNNNKLFVDSKNLIIFTLSKKDKVNIEYDINNYITQTINDPDDFLNESFAYSVCTCSDINGYVDFPRKIPETTNLMYFYKLK